jgi:hypothetical protein
MQDPWVSRNFAFRQVGKIVASVIRDKLSSLKPWLTRHARAERIYHQLGDLVIFDLRIWHCSTPCNRTPTSRDKRKLAIFLCVVGIMRSLVGIRTGSLHANLTIGPRKICGGQTLGVG